MVELLIVYVFMYLYAARHLWRLTASGMQSFRGMVTTSLEDMSTEGVWATPSLQKEMEGIVYSIVDMLEYYSKRQTFIVSLWMSPVVLIFNILDAPAFAEVFLSKFQTSISEELDAILASKLVFKLELKTENVEDKKS